VDAAISTMASRTQLNLRHRSIIVQNQRGPVRVAHSHFMVVQPWAANIRMLRTEPSRVDLGPDDVKELDDVRKKRKVRSCLCLEVLTVRFFVHRRRRQ